MNQRGFAPILVILGVSIVVVISGGAYYLSRQSKVTPTQLFISSPLPTNSGSLPQKASTDSSLINVKDWKVYHDPKGLFSLKYPPNAAITALNNPLNNLSAQYEVIIDVQSIDSIIDKYESIGDSTDAQIQASRVSEQHLYNDEVNALNKGHLPDINGGGVNLDLNHSFFKVEPMGATYGALFVWDQPFNACGDAIIHPGLLFYSKGYRIEITVVPGNFGNVASSMPEIFTYQNNSWCGNSTNMKPKTFTTKEGFLDYVKLMTSPNSPPKMQEWDNIFNQIIKTVSI